MNPISTNQKDANRKAMNDKNASRGDMNPKETNQDDKRFWAIIAVFVIVVALVMFGIHRSANAPSPANTAAMTASTTLSTSTEMTEGSASSTQAYNYSCDDDRSITATFHLPKDDFVNINLSDGRHLILAHVISADGARYANANESVVFWTRGVTAFMQENGTTTYSGCVANRFP